MKVGRHAVVVVGLSVALAACGTYRAETSDKGSVTANGLAGSALAQIHDFTEATAGPQVSTEYAIVTFKSPPAAQYEGGQRGLARTKPDRGQKLDPNSGAVRAYESFLSNEHASYRAYLARVAPRSAVLREYTLALNGLAVQTNGASLSTLSSGPNVKEAVYSTVYHVAMNQSLPLIGVTPAWRSQTGLTGQGVRVGVIDSGIDETHPFLACHGQIQHKVFASGVAGFGPAIALDHGTHVSGTIAGCTTTLSEGPLAGRTISGVAPGAQLFDYDVFPAYGGAYMQAKSANNGFSHDIAAAVEEAVRDGMDVVNMSLGGTVEGPNDLLAQAVDAAVDAGVVFSLSAGNEGPANYTIGSPGSAANAITVGAVTNSHYVGIGIRLSTGQTIGGAEGDFDPYAVHKAVDWGLAVASPVQACSAVGSNVSGKIAIIDRGSCTFSSKIRNAQNAGAVGVLVVNNAPGDPSAMGSDGSTNQPTIPAVMVGLSDGPALKVAAGSATATIDGSNPTEIVTSNGGLLAGFSSRGPTSFSGIGKPDVVAPGVNIYSSILDGKYAMFQGTSMAAPHVTGSAALLLQAHQDWSPAEVKAALATTAGRSAALDKSVPGSFKVTARGSGLINVPAALAVPALVTPSNVSFGYHNQGGYSKISSITLSIRSVGSSTTCTASATSGVTLSATQVTATPSATLTVSLDNPAGQVGDTEGHIDLTCNGTNLYVPWTSYQNPPGRG